jgi:ammonia channel protein AmtB
MPLKTAPLTPPSEHFALQDVLDAPSIGSSRIPMIVHCIYQLMFAVITYVPFLAVIREKPPNYQISLASYSQLVPLLNVANSDQ